MIPTNPESEPPRLSALLRPAEGPISEFDIFFVCNGCGTHQAAGWATTSAASEEFIYRCGQCGWILLEIVPSGCSRGREYRDAPRLSGYTLIIDARLIVQSAKADQKQAFMASDPWSHDGVFNFASAKSIDLLKFEKKISSDSRYKSLSGAIRALNSIGSMYEDIQFCLRLCEAGKSLEISKTTGNSNNWSEADYLAVSGMINYAIAMYYRATEINPKNTKRFMPFNLKSKLEDDSKVWHDRIRDIRSRSIAHYGDAVEGEYSWNRDALVMYLSEEKMYIRYPPVRTSFLKQVADNLEKLCHSAIGVMHKELKKREQAFNFEVHTAILQFPVLKDVLMSSKFDAFEFFKDEDIAQRFVDIESAEGKNLNFVPTWRPGVDRY